ncbi:myopalladin isoform X2 [Brienomyrus brachyistius]|uniref:myopalladin isoform X2 n=1 Tax=Brienomyrus brachyistius TaxID=42636 RepID=UPI0020B3C196|nr:myopalladin isoform X2 [Brienomyrus brachyistius]
MQGNSLESSSSSPRLRREGCLAESGVQQRQREMNHSDGAQHLLYGRSEDMGVQDQSPDLSAFLSEEELDKSVNLAQQAISQGPQEGRAEEKVPLVNSSKASASSEKKGTSQTQSAPPERQILHTTGRENDIVRNNRTQKEPIQDVRKPVRNTSYGPEAQSKKEFLNKAADFIEELSSLFKANSSKRIRPRACKAHRSRCQTKAQPDEAAFAFTAEDRERPVSTYASEPPVHMLSPLEVAAVSLIQHDTQQDQCDTGLPESNASMSVPSLPQKAAEPVMEPPCFLQKLKSREVPEGSKVQLDCIVRGCPAPEVRWFCEGKELESSPDILISSEGELHSLIITEAFEEDTGRYSCFASNVYGTDSTSAEIYIEGASSSDSDGDHRPEHATQPQRKPSQSISAAPPPSRAPPAREEDPPSVTPSTTPFTVQLPVQDISSPPPAQMVNPPTPLQENQNAVSCPQSLDGMVPVSAPVFTKNLQDIIASEGQLVVLECRVKGIPSPQVEWCREGTTVDDSPDFRILQKKPRFMAESEEICTLVIAEVFPEDSGTFTCTAKNKYGSVSSVAYLQVKGYEDSGKDRVAVPGESAQRVRTGPVSRDASSLKVPADVASMGQSSERDALTFSTMPVAEGTFIHQNEPHPAITSTDPFTLSLNSRLEDGNVNHNKPLPRLEDINVNHNKPLPRLEDINVNHNKPLPRLEDINVNHNKPLPRLEDINVNHNKPLPRLEDINVNHNKPLPRLEDINVNHNKPLPRLEDINVNHNKPPPRLEDMNVNHNKPLPRLEDMNVNHNKPLPKLEDMNVNHNKPLPWLEGSHTHHNELLPRAEGGLLHHHNSPSSFLPPDVFSQHTLAHPSEPFCRSLPPSSVTAQRPPWPGVSPQELAASPKPRPQAAPTDQAEPWLPPSAADAPSSCLKPRLLNQSESRTNSRTGLRVHFKLPEDEPDSPPPEDPHPAPEASADSSPTTARKDPPAVRAKPRLDPAQLQILHNQVLLEQKQDSTPQSIPDPTPCSPPSHHEPRHDPVNLPITQEPVTPGAPASAANMAQGFSYTRPKEFIAAQTQPPFQSLSTPESPVPMLNALAAQIQLNLAVDSGLPPLSPTSNQHAMFPRQFPTRVLQSPSSPPTFLSSPVLKPPAPAIRAQSPPQVSSPIYKPPAPAIRAQSPPQVSSPTSSCSSPSPIQDPVAFLSSVLPSLPTSPPTNEMGLPKSAPVLSPQGLLRRLSRPPHSVSDDDIRDGKETVLNDLERKLRLREQHGRSGQQEYKVSNFEQRLMSEIEFRLERTPVEESDDEVHHDEIPTGKCIAPIFDKKLKNFRAMEGVPLAFTCKVVGIPIPKVYWFKDGKQILKKNEHYKRVREGDGTCSLQIEAVTSDDDGNYTVMAANPQGRSSCSGHLIVQTGPVRRRLTPMIHTQRVNSRSQEAEEGEPIQERFFQPHFLQVPGDMVAHEGKLCRLDCKVSGLPNPELMWLRNGRPMVPDLRHRMLVRENGVHSLLIDPLTKGDAGTFTCIATNKAGQNSFSLELTVMEKEVRKVPMFLERFQNIGIAEGMPVRLECRVAGVPPPVIYWKKDNESILPNRERMSMHQDATGYVCLLIQPTRKEDAGWYTVSAKNEAGIGSCTARLDIYAQWHQQIPPPMRKARPPSSRYAALVGQGLDVMSAFPNADNSPILFSSSPVEAALESEEL